METDLTPYFKTLGLLPGASEEQIQEAYQELNSVWHPDRFSHDSQLSEQAKKRLKAINLAYSRLCTANIIQDTRTIEINKANISVVEKVHFGEAEESLPNVSPQDAKKVEPAKPEVNKSKTTNSLTSAPGIHSSGRPIMRLRNNKKGPENNTIIEPPKPRKAPPQETPKVETPLPPNIPLPAPKPAPVRPSATTPPKQKNQSNAPVIALVFLFVATISFLVFQSLHKETQDEPSSQEPLLVEAPSTSKAEEEPTPTELALDPQTNLTTLTLNESQSNTSPPNTKPSSTTAADPPPPNEPKATKIDYFTLGSTYEEVETIQGKPTSRISDQWNYRYSYIFFENGKVSGWHNTANMPLKVNLLPKKPNPNPPRYFTFNSSKDDVLAVQGTPTRISDERQWAYGDSIVIFNQQGKVVSWIEDPAAPGKLKAHQIHSPAP